MNIQQQMVGHADIPASHQALLKVLISKGVLTEEDLAAYFSERKIAIEHLAALGATLTLAAIVERGTMPADQIGQTAEQMGIKDFAAARVKCVEALDYITMEEGDRAEAKRLLNQLGS